jgi:hypothetical protein
MNRKRTEAVRVRALAHLATIDYDFDRFTLQGFTRWLEHRRGRRIVLVSHPMPATLFGAWLAGDADDYVFYEADTHPLHQTHICLHEMAHMLCGHLPVRIDSLQTQVPLQQANADGAAIDSLLLRSTREDQIEQEAELLAGLIQDRVLRAAQARALAATTAKDGNLAGLVALLQVR